MARTSKEYYFYLDSTPTHSYMKYLYKYPQREYPYRDLVETNRERSREEMEYELLDTGIFDDDRYFDVFVEYAKAAPEDVLVQHYRAQPRTGGGTAAGAADALVPQHMVVGRGRSQAVPARRGSLASFGPHIMIWANTGSTAKTRRRRFSPKTKPMRNGCGISPTLRPS